jgi:hypothetical protein
MRQYYQSYDGHKFYYKTQRGQKIAFNRMTRANALLELEGGLSWDDVKRHVKGVWMAIKGVRTNLKPSVREILEKVGDIPIREIYICRQLLGKTYNQVLNLFNRIANRKMVHDQLFHLYLICVLENGQKIAIEKNEDINMFNYKNQDLPKEIIKISDIPKGLTINVMLQNTRNQIGDHDFFTYNAFSTNCQHFVYHLIESNIRSHPNPEEKRFILQDVKDLAPDWSQKMAFFLTSLKNRINTVIQGEGTIYDGRDT